MPQHARSAFDDPDRPSEELLLQCIHCGLCLPTCPTYIALGTEADSPRGRLYLMAGAVDEQREMTDRFVHHMNLCLLCRACETACPSGVRFGSLMESTRAQIRSRYRQSTLERFERHLIFETLLPNQRRLESVFWISRIYQRIGLQRLMRRSGLVQHLPGGLRYLDEYAPPVPSRFFRAEDHPITEPEGRKEHRVGFFSGCIMSVIYATANEATLSVLAKNGCEVITPPGQRCCGALHVHSGELERARRLARENIDAFEEADVEFVVSNAGGCGATLKEYPELLRMDRRYATKAQEFGRKVLDFSEFLNKVGLNKDFGPIQARVTYQDSCHLAHVQRIREQPRSIIKSIPGVEFVEMKEADHCCGSAGSYWLTNHGLSMELLETKMANVMATKADTVVTSNPPCLMQLRLGVERKGTRMKVVHLAELLDLAYSAGKAKESNRQTLP